MTARFREIDDQNRSHHYNLTADDKCYFLHEYTSGKNYTFSETNRLISNLKKKPSLAGTAQYQYKTMAIQYCGRVFGEGINPAWLAVGTLVPVPPSKALSDPEYDDRILQICRAIPAAVDIRELVVQTRSLPADHEGGPRHRIEDLLEVYSIDESKATPAPQSIAIVDDVLTNGTHFRAMKAMLQRRFPDVPVAGLDLFHYEKDDDGSDGPNSDYVRRVAQARHTCASLICPSISVILVCRGGVKQPGSREHSREGAPPDKRAHQGGLGCSYPTTLRINWHRATGACPIATGRAPCLVRELRDSIN